MADSKVSLRYAKSLLDSSIEKKNLDVVSTDIEFVVQSIESNLELARVLESPVIKPELKISILTEIFKSRVDSGSMQFLRFVVEKGREDLLLNILKKFLELRDEHLGIVNVVVKTAFEFTAEQKDILRKKLEEFLGKKVRFSFKIDESIIGGFVAKFGDTVYDASLTHQLELLKKQFLHGGASLN